MAKPTKRQNFQFKVVFRPETGKEEAIDFICEFMKEVTKTRLSINLPFYDEVGGSWIIPVSCCLSQSMPCAECLWSIYIHQTLYPMK